MANRTRAEEMYYSLRRDLLNTVEKLTQEGYALPPEIIPEIPDVINADAVRRLREIKPEFIYQSAYKVRPEEGSVSGLEIEQPDERGIVGRTGGYSSKDNDDIDNDAEYGVGMDLIRRIEDYIQAPINQKSEQLQPIIFDYKQEFYMLLEAVKNEGKVIEFARRLSKHSEDVSKCIDILYWDSNSENLRHSYTRLYKLLLQSKNLSKTPKRISIEDVTFIKDDDIPF